MHSSEYGPEFDRVDGPRVQLLVTTLALCGIVGAYYWTRWLTAQWTAFDLVPFLKFWGVLSVIKFVTVRCARYVDAHKCSALSLEVLLTFNVQCFYCVFYRNLFLHIGRVEHFIALEALHCALEVFVFPLRMSRFYFAHTERLQRTINSKGGCCLRPLLSLLCDESSYHIWSVRLCIDYTLTRIAAIGSAVGYLFGALWLRYGYNAYFYDVHTVSDAQFDKTIAF